MVSGRSELRIIRPGRLYRPFGFEIEHESDEGILNKTRRLGVPEMAGLRENLCSNAASGASLQRSPPISNPSILHIP